MQRYNSGRVEQAIVWLAALLVIWIPGVALAGVLRPRPSFDPAVAIATELGLGIVLWPLLFLWWSTAGLRWTKTSLISILVIAATVAIVTRARRPPLSIRRLIAPAIVVSLTAFTRIAQIRDVVLPLWVDSVHHTMIVRLFLDHGRLPRSYEPFIAHSSFYYHWGFHALAMQVALVTGRTGPDALPRLILYFGQFLNTLTPVFTYAAGRVLFGSRRVGLLAAVLASLVSVFPAYYVSWGRYTHLVGVLLLPPLGVALYRSSRKLSPSSIAEATLLSAGLMLIHVRAAFFAAAFAAVLGVILLQTRRRFALITWTIAALGALLIISPWLVRVARAADVRKVIAPHLEERARWETPNAIPPDLLWAPHNAPLIVIATAGLAALTPVVPLTVGWRVAGVIWWLTIAAVLYTPKRRGGQLRAHLLSRAVVIIFWLAIVAILINLDRLGLPRIRLAPNSAAIITLFLPLSLLAAAMTSLVISVVAPRRFMPVSFVVAAILAVAGAASMTRIINPVTLLAREADLKALNWIRSQTSPQSVFAVGVQPWIGGSFIGVDGGYWIPLVAERRSTLPPGLYTWVAPETDVTAANRHLAIWSTAREVTPELHDAIETERVTHAYFGPSNRSPLRKSLASTGLFRPIYEQEGVTILERVSR